MRVWGLGFEVRGWRLFSGDPVCSNRDLYLTEVPQRLSPIYLEFGRGTTVLKGEDKNGREMEEENVRRPVIFLQRFVLETQKLKIQRETICGLSRGS